MAATHSIPSLTQQREQRPLWASKNCICLSSLGFFLLTVYFLSLYLPVYINTEPPSLPQNCSDSCLAGDERDLHYRDWSDVSLHQKNNVLPAMISVHGCGPALARVLWHVWVSRVCVQIKVANIWCQHLLLTRPYYSAEIRSLTTHFSSLCPHCLEGKQNTCQSSLLVQSRQKKR